MSEDKKEIDEISGVDTTGHEWDGIKELNNPMPRWWVYTFYVTVIWGVIYMFLYPSIPLINDYYKGYFGKTLRDGVHEELAQVKQERSQYSDRMATMAIEDIKNDGSLNTFAMEAGRAAFGDNCAPCHGTGAQGFVGYPNLNDDEWIWGGTLDDIEYTINYGIRGIHDDTRFNDMPAYLRDELLTKAEINEVATYVESLSNGSIASSAEGQQIFVDNCAMCHGEDGKGMRELGAPNLTDAITLYVTDRDSIVDIVSYSRGGVMPTWNGRLDDATIKSLAIYVHSLGGGE
ncbi:cytochrome-c oxidase, cbb3-type subunit III [Pseudemcibacter aquimaris]|uniref:cytochrome-c oxidase, cbb3-type subunit III n=1 Tax=Pseudemcibacter aquimaris TaxID=2857064 RepID=UPI0020137F70|nr:cytochrome-c oxidase, cbb3-type subunit III [Pseudemcibacter aquimaris]MCC3862274.1 cytochrome-c oxidase, cbb3-type subunit III [Pseudemcibacter aquimaris]WDU59024.1 cytochrome-c oxidase, cbb3-type subunit III [Pseudemcibacter aquimaris]